MVPTMILFGVALGRWWRWALVGAAIVWPVLLLVDGVAGIGPQLLGASALGVANAAVGIAAHQLVFRGLHKLRASQP